MKDKLTNEQSTEEKSPLDDQWLAMSEDWQAQPYEKVDMDALVKQT